MAVMLLGAIYPTDTQADVGMVIGGFETTVELGGAYLRSLPTYMLEVAMALLPIFVFFLLFQVFSLRLRRLPSRRVRLRHLKTTPRQNNLKRCVVR